MSIRNTAKAIIINDGKILLNKCKNEKGDEYYSLPGGGQHQHESLYNAVVRECLEETGYKVNPVRFAALCETISMNQDYREKYPEHTHKIYHVFICELTSEKISIPTEKDSTQLDSEWIDIISVKSINLFPKAVGNNILDVINGTAQIFFGSEYIDITND